MNQSLKEKQELGRSLIVIGRKLRDGIDPEVSEETLDALRALIPDLPKAEEPTGGRQPKVDELMELILGWVRDGETIPTGTGHKAIQNALTKLRRNGQILNEGSVQKPKWRVTTLDEKFRLAKEVRERRKEYDRQRAMIR